MVRLQPERTADKFEYVGGRSQPKLQLCDSDSDRRWEQQAENVQGHGGEDCEAQLAKHEWVCKRLPADGHKAH